MMYRPPNASTSAFNDIMIIKQSENTIRDLVDNLGRLNDFLKLLRALCTIAHWKGLVPKVSKLVLFLL